MVDAPSSTLGVPVVRARYCQEWLDAAKLLGEPWCERFLASIPRDIHGEIENASRVAWLPSGYHTLMADRLLEVCGAPRAHDYYRRAFAASLRGPLLGPLLATGSRVLGVSPATLVRWAGRGWEASFKNTGRLEGTVLGPGRAKLWYLDLPPVCTASTAWLQAAQGSGYGAYDVIGATGIVRVDLSQRGEGKMCLDLEWNVR